MAALGPARKHGLRMSATHAPASGRARPRWVVPLAIGGAVLFLCCLGGVVVFATSGDPDGVPGATSGPDTADPVPVDAEDGGSPGTGAGTEAEPEPEPEPEPAGFGSGVWEVGTEIPSGTYVTVVPEGGVFDSCYWARLSGFSGDFEEIIANDNLNAGARGRLELSGSDAGVEFSGGCEWVEVSEATPVEVGAEVGEGVWAVGEEIRPGTYTTDVPDGDVFDSCYWARLSGFSGEFGDIVTNDNVDAGSRGRVEISSSDAGVLFSGDCVWTRN